MRLVGDAGNPVGIDFRQMLRKSRSFRPFAHDAKAALHRDVFLRALQHVL